MIALGSDSMFRCQMLATAQSPWTCSFGLLTPLSRHRSPHRFRLLNQSPAARQRHHEWDYWLFCVCGLSGAFSGGRLWCRQVWLCASRHEEIDVACPQRESWVSGAVTPAPIRRVPTGLCLGFGAQPRHSMATGSQALRCSCYKILCFCHCVMTSATHSLILRCSSGGIIIGYVIYNIDVCI